MKDLLPDIKRFFTVKLVISIISVAGIVPLLQALYWTFEAAYFGHFGVSPEIFSRPVFSSDFISVWLFVSAIYPAFMIWTGFIGIIFTVLVVFNFEVPEFMNSKDLTHLPSNPEQNIDGTSLSSQNWKQRAFIFASNLADSVIKSMSLPLIFWAGGLLVLFMSIFLFIGADSEGQKLAKEQLESYSNNLECIDGINNNNIGCFSIGGVEGEDHLVITNSKTHLIYLSRSQPDGKATKQPTQPPRITLHIIEKAPGEVYRIAEFKRRPEERDSKLVETGQCPEQDLKQ